jgi:hypothetical protein
MILAYCGKLDISNQAFRSKPMDYSESDKFRKQFVHFRLLLFGVSFGLFSGEVREQKSLVAYFQRVRMFSRSKVLTVR